MNKRVDRSKNNNIALILMSISICIAVLLIVWIASYLHNKINEIDAIVNVDSNNIIYVYNRSKEPQPVQWHIDAEPTTNYRLTPTESIRFSYVQLWFDDNTWTTEVILSLDGVFDAENVTLRYDDTTIYPDSRLYHDNYAYTYIFTIPAHIEIIKAVYEWQGRNISLTIENIEVQPDYFSTEALRKAGVIDEQGEN